ncbi:MAG: type II toxin-antitoxin system VapC family toxin [Isosphaeraceae bacterium]|nr:type II toxin-antitoxin system VapC family toxin [Isosphaeraceae bacterium]
MKPRVYLETTVPSYLTAWPSRDLVRAAHQQITCEWWERRNDYELFVSQLVIRECQAGDQVAAAARLAALAGLPLLEHSEVVETLAQALRNRVPLPERAIADALHIATAAAHGMDYLLTWNCTHIANVTLRGRIEAVCRDIGYEPPAICTPEEYPLEGTTMIEDDVMCAVRTAREEYCRQFGYDLGAIVRDLQEQERSGGRRVVRLPPRRPEATSRNVAESPASR